MAERIIIQAATGMNMDCLMVVRLNKKDELTVRLRPFCFPAEEIIVLDEPVLTIRRYLLERKGYGEVMEGDMRIWQGVGTDDELLNIGYGIIAQRETKQ